MSPVIIKELIGVLEDSLRLTHQEVVAVRNDLIVIKIEVEKLKDAVARIEKSRALNIQIISALSIAIISAIASLTTGILQYVKR